jgi:hypothetical protein
VGGDVRQPDDGWIISRFGDYGSTVAVGHKNAGAILQSEDAFGGSAIVFKGRFGFLNNAYLETVLDKDVVNAFPARTICPRAISKRQGIGNLRRSKRTVVLS